MVGLPDFQRVLDWLFADGAGLWPADAAGCFYGNQRAWDLAGEGITKAMTKGKSSQAKGKAENQTLQNPGGSVGIIFLIAYSLRTAKITY
jgi:hypothetical protein